MKQIIVRIRAKQWQVHEAGRFRGQAQALLDAADNLEALNPEYATVANTYRARAAELAAQSEAMIDRVAEPSWLARMLSALRPKWYS